MIQHACALIERFVGSKWWWVHSLVLHNSLKDKLSYGSILHVLDIRYQHCWNWKAVCLIHNINFGSTYPCNSIHFHNWPSLKWQKKKIVTKNQVLEQQSLQRSNTLLVLQGWLFQNIWLPSFIEIVRFMQICLKSRSQNAMTQWSWHKIEVRFGWKTPKNIYTDIIDFDGIVDEFISLRLIRWDESYSMRFTQFMTVINEWDKWMW